jgi:hypothetical protein
VGSLANELTNISRDEIMLEYQKDRINSKPTHNSGLYLKSFLLIGRTAGQYGSDGLYKLWWYMFLEILSILSNFFYSLFLY